MSESPADLSAPNEPCNTNRWLLEITAEAEVIKAPQPDGTTQSDNPGE